MDSVSLGYDHASGALVELPYTTRERGTAVIGVQGTGKTNLLARIAWADMERGDGLCVLSPHPDLTEAVLQHVPVHRRDDVVVIAPYDKDPVGLNIFSWAGLEDEVAAELIVDQVVEETFKLLWTDSWGARMEEMLENTARVIVYSQSIPEVHRPTLADFAVVVGLNDPRYRNYLLEQIATLYPSQSMRDLVAFWQDFDRLSDRLREEKSSSTLNKARRFSANKFLSHLFGQGHLSRFAFREAMDKCQIVIVDLNLDKLGPRNVEVIGRLLVSQLYLAGLGRPLPAAKPFHIVADEFGFFASPIFATIQDQLRKYRVTTLVAHQRREQLDPQTRSSTLAAANRIVFTVSSDDAKDLAPGFDRTPPEPGIRGYRQELVLAGYPWDYLKRRGHEQTTIARLVHRVDYWLAVDVRWNLASTLAPRLGLAQYTEELDFTIWGFPKQAYKDAYEMLLNKVLFLMMTEAPGADIAQPFQFLGNGLFRFENRWGRYEAISGDPPVGYDWGKTTLLGVGYQMVTAPAEGWERTYWPLQNAKRFGRLYARVAMRHYMLHAIARLGDMLRQYPVWERGGQPEPDYEPRQTVMDYTASRENELTQLPKFEAWCKLADQGEFQVETLEAPPPPADGAVVAEAIREMSRKRFGVDRDLIERVLMERRCVTMAAAALEGKPDTEAGEIMTADKAKALKSRFRLSL
jgi:hypothetical protein